MRTSHVNVLLPLALTSFILFWFIASCSEGGANPDRTLQLTIGSYTEQELRVVLHEAVSGQDEAYSIACRALDDLSDNEAVEAYAQLHSAIGETSQFVDNDEERFIQIFRDECEAAFDR